MIFDLKLVGNILVGFVALEHLYFLVLEMFLWTKPLGLKTFNQNKKQAEVTKVLAGNQGLYNGFLAAGLIWSLLHVSPGYALQLKLFFLSCVAVAGVYGAYSVSPRILYVQAFPALLTLLIFLFGNYGS